MHDIPMPAHLGALWSKVHQYEKAGFQHDPEIMIAQSGRYDRCNVAMRYPNMRAACSDA